MSTIILYFGGVLNTCNCFIIQLLNSTGLKSTVNLHCEILIYQMVERLSLILKKAITD